MEKHRVSLIIPTKNEIEGMKWFMPQLKKEWYDELIIIDGGSTDGTIEYCKAHNYPIFQQNGVGLHAAYDDAYNMITGDIVVTITPDGNSLPELVPPLTDKIREGYDMVIASRYMGKARSYDDDFMTAIGNKCFTVLINLLFRASYTDALVGLRAYKKEAIEKMNLLYLQKQGWLNDRFYYMNSWESGSCIRAAKLGLKVTSIPGDEPKRIGGIRKLSIIKNGLGILLQIIIEFIIGKKFVTAGKEKS